VSRDTGAVREHLARLSGSGWELYVKESLAREIRESPGGREEIERVETGLAARWDDGEGVRFAAASSPKLLASAIDVVRHLPGAKTRMPELPPAAPPAAEISAAEPGELSFENLGQQLAAESRGQGRLLSLTMASAEIREQLVNGRGFEGVRSRRSGYGMARAAGLAGERRLTADYVFPLEPSVPELLERTAAALADRISIPLKGRASPFARGELLLAPPVAAALIAATLPLFCGGRHRLLVSRKYLDRGARFGAAGFSWIDDAANELPFDAEGVRVSRREVISDGVFQLRLHDLSSARDCGERPTGNAVRTSYRTPPRPGSERFFVAALRSTPAAELLSMLSRGLVATSAAAPPRVDLEADSFRIEIEGWAVAAGKARSPVARAVVEGRLSEFWRHLMAGGDDLQFFPLGGLVGSPSLLIDRAVFR